MNSLVKDDLELILLSPPPQFWNYRPPATFLPFRVFLLCLFNSSAHLTLLSIQIFFLLICRHSLHMVDISAIYLYPLWGLPVHLFDTSL